MTALEHSLAALAALVAEPPSPKTNENPATPAGASNRAWAIAGALSARKFGILAQVAGIQEASIEVIASAPHPDQHTWPSAGADGRLWTPPQGLPIIWRTRLDHYADLWRAVAQSGEPDPSLCCGYDLPIISGPAQIALFVQQRQPKQVLALLLAGHMDFDEALAFTTEHLGPYARDDLDAVMQEAHWQFMRKRYTGDVH